MPSPPFREGLGIGLIILKDMKKVYVAPQSEIVELVGKTATMADIPLLSVNSVSGPIPPGGMY